MKKRTHWAAAAAVMVLTLSSVTLAEAQVARRYPGPSAPSWTRQSVFDDGYRMGVVEGERDGRRGRRYQANARGAWNSRGSRYGNDLRRAFEDGYESGYREGYARYDRRSSRNQGTDPYYRGSGPVGGYGDYGRYQSPALDVGYRDGYEEGLDAGRDRDRYDPVREKDYRKADRGYHGRFGPKARYQVEYREAFKRGYDEGYRDATRYDRRDSRSRVGPRWPF